MVVRIIFLILLILHGLIHLMGFFKAYDIAEIEALKLPISQITGLAWAGVAVLFLFAAADYLMGIDWWWIPAAIGVLSSQVLVIMYWQDAKFGSIANAIILIACLIGYGQWNFQKMVNKERSEFVSSVSEHALPSLAKSITALPNPVQRWLKRSDISDQGWISTVKFSQRGRMKITPDGSWLPVKARQLVRIANPGFLWIAEVEAAPYIYLAGRDKYMEGRGHMLIKLLSLLPVADAKGPEIDQGAMLRYLAEMVWYPSAAMAPYIRWTSIDDRTAKASMSYGGITASGTFSFGKEGAVTGFKALRYYSREGKATLEPWSISIDSDSYRLVKGWFVPAKARLTWELEDGDFTWYELEVYNINFNQ